MQGGTSNSRSIKNKRIAYYRRVKPYWLISSFLVPKYLLDRTDTRSLDIPILPHLSGHS